MGAHFNINSQDLIGNSPYKPLHIYFRIRNENLVLNQCNKFYT